MDWLCKDCFKLDGQELELHIQAHARATVWSYDEVKGAIQQLRVQAEHCEDCRATIYADLKPMTVETAITQFGLAWGRLVTEINEALAPITSSAPSWAAKLREAGLIKDEAPTDPKARALWARQNRSTGPARPSGPWARRPRRHQ